VRLVSCVSVGCWLWALGCGSAVLPKHDGGDGDAPAGQAGRGGSGITTGPDGNLWFTEPTVNKIGRFVPP
jgi:streptogramin lyase